jgi:hypothetical protein
MALAAGIDRKVVQEMLGHSSETITSDTYTSVLPELQREAANAIAALLAQAAGTPCITPRPAGADRSGLTRASQGPEDQTGRSPLKENAQATTMITGAPVVPAYEPLRNRHDLRTPAPRGWKRR